jgi:hypothetical protein
MRFKLPVLCVAVLLARGVASGCHDSRNLLQQTSRRPVRVAGDALSSPDSRNRDGRIFDFASFGGAVAYLARLDAQQLQSIMRNSGWDRGVTSLGQKLDADRDFVSSRALAHC